MSGPKELSFEATKPTTAVEQLPKPDTSAPRPNPQSVGEGPLPYANRCAAQKYHPVILIGSAAAGKTVLLLSLLAFFKTRSTENRLSVFFGEDFFRPGDTTVREQAESYFDLSVADYIRGTAGAATKIGAPLFIPCKVSGASRSELKFAFMESDGEWYQPDRRPNARFLPPFKPELESLLRQYPDGISFIWVAPHMPEASAAAGIISDPEELMRQAGESLSGGFANYERVRRHNSLRDTHMFLVTKWDTYFSDTAAADVRQNLARENDEWISHEVDTFITTRYHGPYGAFQAVNSPLENKTVFRYSAGIFDARSKGVGVSDDMLQTYPRDVWNWLYDGMLKGHDWDFERGPLVPLPVPPKRTILDIWDDFIGKLLG